MKLTMTTETSEKGLKTVKLTDRQIQIAQNCVGAGQTPYQRRAGYVLLWQMALRTGDTKLAVDTLKNMREESRSLKSRKRRNAEKSVQQNLVIIENKDEHDARIKHAQQRIGWASGRLNVPELDENDHDNAK